MVDSPLLQFYENQQNQNLQNAYLQLSQRDQALRAQQMQMVLANERRKQAAEALIGGQLAGALRGAQTPSVPFGGMLPPQPMAQAAPQMPASPQMAAGGALPLAQLQQQVLGLEGNKDYAVGAAGELGPGQIKPSTGAEYGFRPDQLYGDSGRRASGVIVGDLYRQSGGDAAATLVGYNAGPGAMRKFQSSGDDPNSVRLAPAYRRAVSENLTDDQQQRASDIAITAAGHLPPMMVGQAQPSVIQRLVEQIAGANADDDVKGAAVMTLLPLMSQDGQRQFQQMYEIMSLQERQRHNFSMEQRRGQSEVAEQLPPSDLKIINTAFGGPAGAARAIPTAAGDEGGAAPEPPMPDIAGLSPAGARAFDRMLKLREDMKGKGADWSINVEPDGTIVRINRVTGESHVVDVPKGTSRQGTNAFQMAQQGGGPESIDTVARGIAEYRIAPLTGWTLKGPWGQQVMSRVMQINPDYQSTQYAARMSATRAFASGRQSDTVRSMSVAIDHLDTAQQLGEALQNTDAVALNRAKNALKTQFGYEGPVDFNTAKMIVADEVTKAVAGGVLSMSERLEMGDQLSAASSPAQLNGVITTLKRLLAGQLGGLERQFEVGTGQPAAEFQKKLSPKAREQLQGVHPQSGGDTVPVPPAFANDPDGTSYQKDDGTWVKKGDKLVKTPGAVSTNGGQ